MWIVKEPLTLNFFPHFWQEYGFSPVSLHVDFQCVAVFEAQTAGFAWVRPLVCVDSCVVYKPCFLTESFPTYVAQKWFVIRVDSLVNLQNARKWEILPADFTQI